MKQCYFKYLISVIFIFIAACEDQNRVSLYSVNQTTPTFIETGDTIRIYGEGFVEGDADITLKGSFKKSGSFKPVKQSIYLKGTAISSSEIQIYVSKEVMTKISDDTVDFTGITKVSFPAVLKESVVSLEAAGPVESIRFSPLGEAVKSRAKNLRESLDILKMTGIIVNKESLDSDIEVSKVITGSLASINNIKQGDILISIDSFPANEI
ncbi:MAG: hypothetical protein JXR91_06375, partial [Deltaproteobacteria bacterium]|nr:hypothetical protein [Deltaproteobacteria bacterium]